MDSKITKIVIDPAGRQLTAVFATGEIRLLNLSSYAKRGGVFAALSDPAYAMQAELVYDGYVIRWPDELDFCADAVLAEGQTGAKFKQVESSKPKRRIA